MFRNLIQNVLEKRQIYQEYLNKVIEYLKLISEGEKLPQGKLIRPIIFFMQSSGEITDKHCETAAIIELIHTASIIHDDIIDSNKTRRGVSSLFALYGRKMSIIKGDFLLISAFKQFMKLFQYDDFAVKYFMRECYSTAYGAILEQQLNQSDNPNMREYIRVASLKTGAMFKLSAILGAYTSGKTFKECVKAAMYGLHFGTIFQIQNDIDSYIPSNFADSEDYVQKNITLPIVMMYSKKLLNINEYKSHTDQVQYELIRKFISLELSH